MSWQMKTKIALGTPIVLVSLLACTYVAMLKSTPKPPASEFGYGPRQSASGAYILKIEEAAAFKKGKILSTVIVLQDARGSAVEGADIAVDGGMPQHGHGLPTKPRVTRSLGSGRYQVEGLKFNMGGWWELKFAIRSGAVSDSITFNLEL